MWAWRNSRTALAESALSGKVPSNHSDFATVIAAELEPTVYVLEKVAQIFDMSGCRHGSWTVTPKERVKAICRTTLLNVFRGKSHHRTKDGKMETRYSGPQPHACKTTTLQNSVSAQVLPMLTRPHPHPLNSDSTRRYLADKDGLVYDFVLDQFLSASPIDLRIGYRLLWSFDAEDPREVWKSEKKSRAEEVVKKIYNFWWSQPDVKTASLEKDQVFGKPLADALRVAASPVLKLLLDLFEGDADEAMYMINMSASFACSWQNRCEYVYMHGPGNSGKDLPNRPRGKLTLQKTVTFVTFCVPFEKTRGF
jgi:hypothetical protein